MTSFLLSNAISSLPLQTAASATAAAAVQCMSFESSSSHPCKNAISFRSCLILSLAPLPGGEPQGCPCPYHVDTFPTTESPSLIKCNGIGSSCVFLIGVDLVFVLSECLINTNLSLSCCCCCCSLHGIGKLLSIYFVCFFIFLLPILSGPLLT